MSDLTTVLDTVKNGMPDSTLTELAGWEENLRFLGIKIINVGDFSELLVRLALNIFVTFLVVQYMYARNSRRKDFYFSFMAVGTVVFLLSFLLNSVKLELGFALGLFAIFEILAIFVRDFFENFTSWHNSVSSTPVSQCVLEDVHFYFFST